MPDNDEPLSMDDAISAFVGNDEKRPPEEDKPTPEAPDEENALDSDDELELADEEGETQEEVEDDPQAPQPESFASDDTKVKLEDGSVITVADLRKGNLFQADWTRKSMALSEEKKSFEAQQTHVQQLEQALLQQRETVAAVAETFMPKPPNPEMMNPNSPEFDIIGYQQQKLAYEHMVERVGRLMSDRKQAELRQEHEKSESFQQKVREEQKKLFERAPELAKPETYQKYWQEAVTAAADYGISADELNEMTDHRQYLVWKDALAYRRLKARNAEAKAKAEGKPPVLTGSPRRSPENVRQQNSKAALARLNQTGSVKDGIAALLALEKE